MPRSGIDAQERFDRAVVRWRRAVLLATRNEHHPIPEITQCCISDAVRLQRITEAAHRRILFDEEPQGVNHHG